MGHGNDKFSKKFPPYTHTHMTNENGRMPSVVYVSSECVYNLPAKGYTYPPKTCSVTNTLIPPVARKTGFSSWKTAFPAPNVTKMRFSTVSQQKIWFLSHVLHNTDPSFVYGFKMHRLIDTDVRKFPCILNSNFPVKSRSFGRSQRADTLEFLSHLYTDSRFLTMDTGMRSFLIVCEAMHLNATVLNIFSYIMCPVSRSFTPNLIQ